MFAIGMEQLIVFTWYIMLHYETFSRLYVVTVHMTNLFYIESLTRPFEGFTKHKTFYMVREQKEVQTQK